MIYGFNYLFFEDNILIFQFNFEPKESDLM